MTIPADSNIREKACKKTEKYQGQGGQLEQMWKVNVIVVPVVTGALWAVTPKQEEWPQQISEVVAEECSPGIKSEDTAPNPRTRSTMTHNNVPIGSHSSLG